MSAATTASHRVRLAIAAGAAALILAACSSSERSAGSPNAAPIPGPQAANTPWVTAPVVEPAATPAPSGEQAVRRYVAAEAAGETAASYALLADDDRARVGSFAMWADEVDERLPVRSIERVELDGTTIVTEATLDARLDEAGFVPARARIEWRPVRTDAGGWLVSLAATQVQALLPPDAAAVEAVTTWVRARQRDDAAAQRAGQYAGNLLGQPALVDGLPAGDVRARTPQPLRDAPDPQVAIAAFGPEAERFVRAVAVDAPTPLVVLVAPLDDTWQVVGVQAPR